MYSSSPKDFINNSILSGVHENVLQMLPSPLITGFHGKNPPIPSNSDQIQWSWTLRLNSNNKNNCANDWIHKIHILHWWFVFKSRSLDEIIQVWSCTGSRLPSCGQLWSGACLGIPTTLLVGCLTFDSHSRVLKNWGICMFYHKIGICFIIHRFGQTINIFLTKEGYSFAT